MYRFLRIYFGIYLYVAFVLIIAPNIRKEVICIMYIVDLLNTKFNSTKRDYNYKIQMKLRVLSLNMNKEQQVYTPFIDILSIKKKLVY